MKKNLYKVEGIVEEKLSKNLYSVQIEKGIMRKVRFSAKLRMHYGEINIGAKVYVELPIDESKLGTFLSATDFKVNGWTGWTEEHEPKYNDADSKTFIS